MTRSPFQSERAEFEAFCAGASNSQLLEIFRRERKAGRAVYAAIADAEMKRRGLEDAR